MVFWQYSRRPTESFFLWGDAKIITLVESAQLLGCPSNVGFRRDAQKLPKRRLLKDCLLNHVVGGVQCQKMRQMADDNYFIPYFYVLLWRGMPWTWLLIAPLLPAILFSTLKEQLFYGYIYFFKKRDDARKISSFFSALLSLSFQLLKGERLV